MTKKIEFVAINKFGYETQPKPYPASQNIPDWWRKEEPYSVDKNNPTGKKILINYGSSNATFKKCTPMLDAITSGYIIPLWADVQVRQENNGTPSINWITKTNVFGPHGESSERVQPPTGYSNNVFKYLNTWMPKTPKGYSVLVTAPFGHRDLPFHVIPAIIDSDRSTLEIVPPMWLKEGFEGVVEKGTPMLQITPFKRENWESEFSYLEDGEFEKNQEKNFNSTLVSHYIKNVWSKKSYK
jgi:hypothetical protein